MGKVPYGTECIEDEIVGFTGDQCEADRLIRCEGGETGWAVCVGGFWVDLGTLPGEDVCVGNIIYGAL